MLAFTHRYLACLTGQFRLTFSLRPVLCVALSMFLRSSHVAAQTVAPSESESDEPVDVGSFYGHDDRRRRLWRAIVEFVIAPESSLQASAPNEDTGICAST
jgi:hypothetical protein